MSFTRFPCPGFEHSQFPLRWATVLWHRGSAGNGVGISCGKLEKAPIVSNIWMTGRVDRQAWPTEDAAVPKNE
jgi:hypothetical protein